jgi:hypothetical protein
LESGEIENAVGRAELFENFGDLGIVPARIAKFEGVAMTARKNFQESAKPGFIAVPIGGELKQDRSQCFEPNRSTREKKRSNPASASFSFFM